LASAIAVPVDVVVKDLATLQAFCLLQRDHVDTWPWGEMPP
jgi:hypothetical protein